ncbi:MAG: hypothetical protein KKF44_06355 [Nanoarchaeota archaeon]|nr:hypothetical protein [Nanoarchaeota archaeon]
MGSIERTLEKIIGKYEDNRFNKESIKTNIFEIVQIFTPHLNDEVRTKVNDQILDRIMVMDETYFSSTDYIKPTSGLVGHNAVYHQGTYHNLAFICADETQQPGAIEWCALNIMDNILLNNVLPFSRKILRNSDMAADAFAAYMFNKQFSKYGSFGPDNIETFEHATSRNPIKRRPVKPTERREIAYRLGNTLKEQEVEPADALIHIYNATHMRDIRGVYRTLLISSVAKQAKAI